MERESLGDRVPRLPTGATGYDADHQRQAGATPGRENWGLSRAVDDETGIPSSRRHIGRWRSCATSASRATRSYATASVTDGARSRSGAGYSPAAATGLATERLRQRLRDGRVRAATPALPADESFAGESSSPFTSCPAPGSCPATDLPGVRPERVVELAHGPDRSRRAGGRTGRTPTRTRT